jgi:UDP-3-O-[3-hydroxymyristoyl] glucosamine N-acyltransferase
MEFTAEQIAGLLNGEIHGDPGVTVNTLAKIEEGHFGALSFLSNPKYEEFIYKTKSSACIVNKTFLPSKDLPHTLTLIKVDDAYQCFAKLLEMYAQMNKKNPEIESPSFVSDSAKIGNGVYIGAFSYIGKNVEVADEVQIYPNCYIGDNVKLGKGSILHPGVSVYHDCKVGENCIIHAGAVIGADGFGFAPDADGVFHKVPQIGNVVVEDNVEIGSNTTIDRATMGSTVIKKGVKIDNLCQIAHNVEIGYNSALAAQVGVAGSAKIGERVMVGGQAGISGHLHIANDTKIVAQSGIPSTVKKPDTLMGSPGIPLDEFKKSYFGFRKLPFILNKLQELEKKIKALTQQNESN